MALQRVKIVKIKKRVKKSAKKTKTCPMCAGKGKVSG